MTYISAQISETRQSVIVWERDSQGRRDFRSFVAPHYFYYEDEEGDYTNIYGKKLSKAEFARSRECREAREEAQASGTKLYESDIAPEYKILSEYYYNKPSGKLNITFLDIETDKDPDRPFATIDDPYAPIISVAIYHQYNNRMVVYAIPPDGSWTPEKIPPELSALAEVVLCDTEEQLLLCLIEEINDSDVISGWNCVPVTSSIWTPTSIESINDAPNELYNSKLVAKSQMFEKPLWRLITSAGHKFESSKDHRLFVRTCPLGRYTDLTINNKSTKYVIDELLTVEQIAEKSKTHSVFVRQRLHVNTNSDYGDLSVEQCYLLGLIYTDGSMRERNCGYRVYQSDYDMISQLPLLTSKICGPYKDCYNRTVNKQLIGSFGHSLIYKDGDKKSLNLTELSKLSSLQFKHFLSGLLDGDGFYRHGRIFFCNFNDDLHTLGELCFWNGIVNSISGTSMTFPYLTVADLHLRKNKRWTRDTGRFFGRPTRDNSQKSESIRFKIIETELFTRVVTVLDTGTTTLMMDIETDCHQFISQGLLVHNSEFYDMPYIYMRLMKLGPQFAHRLSFPDARSPRIKEVEKFKVVHKTVEIFGRVALDYLPLFKKLDSRMRQSYKLEAIAEEELKDLDKLKYSGALSDLYRKDFIYFIRYNIRDTEILKGLEEKLRYIDFAITFSHMATCQIDDVLGTIKPSDMTIINYCHYVMNQKVPDGNREATREGQYAGALVLDPQTGLCEMGSAIDIVSLYPSAERALNISPETMRGQFAKKHLAWEALFYENDVQLELQYENGFSETMSAKEWRVELISRNWCVSGYGTCYTQEFMGFIPAILTEWFQKRKEFKGLMKKAAKDMAATEPGSPDYITAQNAMNYFDRMQYVMKIRLNSIYGAQGNPFFRFYDVRSAESTTRSGQQILLHQVRKIAFELDGEYVYPSSSIIYGDTDSCYFKCHTTDVNDAIEVAKTINELVNESFPEFLAKAFLCNDQFNTMINAEYEFIFDAGVFVKKKLYALHLVYDGGKAVDKLKIMGLQLKKTTIPKPVSKKLIGFLEDLLKGKDFNTTGAQLVKYRDELFNTEDVLSIGLPKGIKGIEDYTERYNIDQGCKIPGHVAAAMLWNKCLTEYNDNLSEKIMTGGKIRVFYLTKTFGRFKSIAVPTDVVELPEWFKEHFYKLVDRKAQVQRLVDDPLKGIFQSMGEKMPTKKSLFVDELVEY